MGNLTGTRLSDQYKLEQRIGSGGMADVYKAWDSARSIYMAIKVLHTELSQDKRTLAMFQKEAQILKNLGHPNIARLYEFRKHQQYHYLVLEWVDGDSLDKIIKKRVRPHSLDEVSQMLSPIASALHYLHNNDVLHCDVKPANILIARNNKIFLTDLGVARSLKSSKTGGTPTYMAPEQFQSGRVSHKTDIYSLGITVFELLSGGNLPFNGTSTSSVGSTLSEKIAWEHNNLPLPSIQSLNRSVPDDIEKVLSKALAKNPENRYPSAFDFFNAYEKAKINHYTRSKPGTSQENHSVTTMLYEQSQRQPAMELNKHPMQSQSVWPNIDEGQKFRGQARLVGLEGEWKQKTILMAHNHLTLGRNNQMQIRFADPRVSRFHATLTKTFTGVYIKDMGSSLGTYVNNKRINGVVKLKHQDKIRIGSNQVLEFRNK